MNLYASPQRLASVWRRMADTATESGETPLLTLGLDAFYPDSGLSLLALSRIARQNLGPLNPTVIAGGEGWLWLLATLVWRPAARTLSAFLAPERILALRLQSSAKATRKMSIIPRVWYSMLAGIALSTQRPSTSPRNRPTPAPCRQGWPGASHLQPRPAPNVWTSNCCLPPWPKIVSCPRLRRR